MLNTTTIPQAARSAPAGAYDRRIAFEFFEAAGAPETVEQGATIFVEYQRTGRPGLSQDRMYLLLEGEVDIIAARKTIGRVRAGEVFGEMAPLSRTARSATAVARTRCRIIGLNEEQFERGLESGPDFALMLMRVMIGRLRDTVARLRTGNALAEDGSGKQTAIFDAAQLQEFAREFGDAQKIRFGRGRTILHEGASGVLMYLMLEGSAHVIIDRKIVERVGPGGVIGEVALVDQSPRLASAIAQTDCTMFSIDRGTFLRLLKARPDFGASLLRGLAERLRFLLSRKR